MTRTSSPAGFITVYTNNDKRRPADTVVAAVSTGQGAEPTYQKGRAETWAQPVNLALTAVK